MSRSKLLVIEESKVGEVFTPFTSAGIVGHNARITMLGLHYFRPKCVQEAHLSQYDVRGCQISVNDLLLHVDIIEGKADGNEHLR